MGEISRLEILDAILDAITYHASQAFTEDPFVLDDAHTREVERLRVLRTRVMAGEQMEAA